MSWNLEFEFEILRFEIWTLNSVSDGDQVVLDSEAGLKRALLAARNNTVLLMLEDQVRDRPRWLVEVESSWLELIGLDWIGLDWIGLDLIGLDSFDLI
jgi:hypothetical protein